MTTREQHDAAAGVCRQCKRDLVEKAKFCDSCGTATTALVSDWETLQHYCARCGGVLRGAKKYCSSCGDPTPHSAEKKQKHDHWLFQAAEDPKIQIAVVLLFVVLAAVPIVFPVRYGLTWQAPFFLIFDGQPQLAERFPAPLATAEWSGRALLPGDDPTLEGAVFAGVARDASGVYYVADTAGHGIHQLTRDGERRRIAGGNEPGFSGDGGPASGALLNAPLGLAVDPYGNLYVADSGNGRIRVIDSDGIIRTIAGCGTGCGERSAIQAAALSIGMRPASLAFAGSNLLVAENPSPGDARDPSVWVLQPNF